MKNNVGLGFSIFTIIVNMPQIEYLSHVHRFRSSMRIGERGGRLKET